MSDSTQENAGKIFSSGLIGATLALLAVLFVSLNLLSSAWFGSNRLDLTEDRLYTLSSSTKTLLTSVHEPVTYRLYISSELAQHVPHMGIYANRVRDLLHEYESASDGMVRVEVLDPAPFTDIEDRAVAVGLQGVPVVSGGEKLYFGLVGSNTTDDIETIPFMQVDREAFQEYDISRMQRTLFAVDQYLLNGGKSMIFVDPFAEAEGMEGQMLGATIDGSSLNEMFKTWGLQFDPTKVVIDRTSAR